MNQTMLRVIVTTVVLAVVAGIGAIIMLGRGGKPAEPSTPAPLQAPVHVEPSASPGSTEAVGATAANAAGAATQPAQQPAASEHPEQQFTARPTGEPFTGPATLGSLDRRDGYKFLLELAPNGVGIKRVIFTDYWRTAAENRQAEAHWKARERGNEQAPPLPPEEARYTLQAPGTLAGFDVTLMAMRYLQVDGSPHLVDLFSPAWTQVSPDTFEIAVVDAEGREQLRVRRTFVVRPGTFDVGLEQRVINTGSTPRTVQWIQSGPPDLGHEQGQLVEVRRFQSGYLMSPERDPAQRTVIVHGATLDHSKVIKQLEQTGDTTIWPTEQQQIDRYGLAWFGATNRYFAVAVHAPYAPPAHDSLLIAPAVARVDGQLGRGTKNGEVDTVVYTYTRSQPLVIAPGQTGAFDMGFFAGPLDRTLLSTVQPFAALNMQGLILYLMSGCCSWCTFAWLADFLIWFLAFLHHYVVFDWGLAIIVLVLVVRLLLHPISKRSQIVMQRVAKQMQAVKPELDAIKARYANDPRKMQEEQTRILREHGVNPLGCAGGMLPTFLQMPIWMALYAVLYFAFELRQQPAFFGVFQQLGGWGFLGDLSAPDRFIAFGRSFNLFFFHVDGINLVPILMGLVFFLQQKYMTPPSASPVSPEVESQQKMMKWMMVLLFPLFLYGAPSGLTLYIATSTLVGVFEGIQVRKAVAKMDFTKPQGNPNGWFARAMARLQERAEEAQRRQQAMRQPQQPQPPQPFARGQGRRFRERK